MQERGCDCVTISLEGRVLTPLETMLVLGHSAKHGIYAAGCCVETICMYVVPNSYMIPWLHEVWSSTVPFKPSCTYPHSIPMLNIIINVMLHWSTLNNRCWNWLKLFIQTLSTGLLTHHGTVFGFCYEIATFEANGDNIWIVSSTRAFGGGQQRAEK